MYKIIKYLAFALGIIGAVFALMIMAGDEATADSMGNNVLYVTYVVLALAILLVLIYVIKGLFSGDIKKTLITVGIFAVIIVISYVLSSGTDLDLTPFTAKGADVNESTSKFVGAGLYTFYILAVLAIGSMLLSGVKKLFNR
jgi:NADH:ubiquinone oxidoreductase subunit 6 (subunit J)